MNPPLYFHLITKKNNKNKRASLFEEESTFIVLSACPIKRKFWIVHTLRRQQQGQIYSQGPCDCH